MAHSSCFAGHNTTKFWHMLADLEVVEPFWVLSRSDLEEMLIQGSITTTPENTL